MKYMGSKSRIKKYVVPILQKIIEENNIDTYIEPFVGGANVIDSIECPTKIGGDKSEPLIELLKYARDGVIFLWKFLKESMMMLGVTKIVINMKSGM